MLLDNEEYNIRVITKVCDNIQTAINFAEINVLHYSNL